MQPFPTPGAVLSVLGPGSLPDEKTILSLLVGAVAAARRVTAGGGFGEDGTTVAPEIAEVLVSSVARSLLNPELPLAEADEPFAVRPGAFSPWTEGELLLLARHRTSRHGRGGQ